MIDEDFSSFVHRIRTDQMQQAQESYDQEGMGRIITWRYWNSNGYNIAIVATQGGIGDWAAYIGATLSNVVTKERVAVVAAAKFGAKLDKRLAMVIFPDISGEYRSSQGAF